MGFAALNPSYALPNRHPGSRAALTPRKDAGQSSAGPVLVTARARPSVHVAFPALGKPKGARNAGLSAKPMASCANVEAHEIAVTTDRRKIPAFRARCLKVCSIVPSGRSSTETPAASAAGRGLNRPLQAPRLDARNGHRSPPRVS